MGKRELGFLPIGFGIGLPFAVAPMVVRRSVPSHVHIEFAWHLASAALALPFALIAVGIVPSRRAPREAGS
jgi:hypothetical protein